MMDKDGSFEVSLRVLGNEFIGLKISVDDMKQKWIVLGIISVGILGWMVSLFGPIIGSMFI